MANGLGYDITWEATLGGYNAFLGNLKVAVIGTRQDQGLFRNGITIYEDVAREEWGIHFTSPSMPITLVKAILDSVPPTSKPSQQTVSTSTVTTT